MFQSLCFLRIHNALLAVPITVACFVLPVIAQTTPVTSTQDTRELRRTPVVDVFENSRDAVVNISSETFVERRGFGGFDSQFDRFFEFPVGPRRRVQMTSVGSGFVLHENGYIVTNAHVVAKTAERHVVFGDGTEVPAEVVAMEVDSDLAILKIETDKPLPVLPLGRSDDLMIGETAIAIGNPFGFQHTVTAGVISALDREIVLGDRMTFSGLIQTDASINPGNSGGPLLNVLGELIGVNSAIRGNAENIGFAIPVDQLREKLPELLNIERRYRVDTGMKLSRNATGLVVVESVAEESAAGDAGIRAGDIVVSIDGEEVSGLVDFHIGLLNHRPGDVVELKLSRAETPLITEIELRERPLPDGRALTQERIGATIEELNANELREIGLRAESLLIVSGVEPGSPAEAIEMRRGDLLIEVNGQTPTTLGDIGMLWEDMKSGDVARLGYMRVRGNSRFQQIANVRVR